MEHPAHPGRREDERPFEIATKHAGGRVHFRNVGQITRDEVVAVERGDIRRGRLLVVRRSADIVEQRSRQTSPRGLFIISGAETLRQPWTFASPLLKPLMDGPAARAEPYFEGLVPPVELGTGQGAPAP